MMLTRLCGDHQTAKAIWERVIKVTLKDELMKLYPWVLHDDVSLEGRRDAVAMTRSFLSGHYTVPNVQTRKVSLHSALGNDTTIPIPIERSYDIVNISLSPLTVNWIDGQLGPATPRFQCSFVDIAIQGAAYYNGVCLDLSYMSRDTVRFKCGLKLSSIFFNGSVSCHEPFIEPWTIGGAITKRSIDDSLNVSIRANCRLMINISAALLQSIASIVVSLESVFVTTSANQVRPCQLAFVV